MKGMVRDVTERKQAEEALRRSEERLRTALSISTVGVMFWSGEGRLVDTNDAFLGMTGFARGEALSKTWHELTPPEFQERSARFREEVETTGEGSPYEKQYYRRDGSRWWGLFAARRLDGGYVEFVLDVSSRREAEAALRESEGRFRTLVEGIPQLVWRSCDRGLWTWSSPQWQAFTGQRQEESHGRGWLEAINPDDYAATMRAWDEARPHGMLDVEYRVRRAADGAYLWHHTRSLPLRDEAGRIVEWLGTTTDVQQLKELQERQAVMVAELQHRTRNLIAVVRSIAGQTMAETGPTEAFRDEFNHRMGALARVQGLLSRSEAEPITMDALIRLELDALGALNGSGQRVRLAGPPVRLRNSVVQTLALAIHELTTNARKHGALATDVGRLDVSWSVRDADGEGHRVLLEWLEQGVDLAWEEQSPASSGYGRELIERALPYALGARTAYELGEAGVRCTIDLPLGRRERGTGR